MNFSVVMPYHKNLLLHYFPNFSSIDTPLGINNKTVVSLLKLRLVHVKFFYLY